MYFKSAVIICALYFVTATQSIGLNVEQLKTLRSTFEEQKKYLANIAGEVSDNVWNRILVNTGKSIQMDMTLFKIEEQKGLTNGQKLAGLLIYLANNDKPTDRLRAKILTSYEVRLYVCMFNDYDLKGNHNGVLSYQHVMKAIGTLDLEKRYNYTQIFKPDEQYDALEFLDRMFEVKPVGHGIDSIQLKNLMDLYDGYDTVNVQLDPARVTKYFKTLSIVKENYDGKFAENSTRYSVFEIQELLLISSEYSVEKKSGTVYTTRWVQRVLSDFIKMDEGKYGVLNRSKVFKMTEIYMYPRQRMRAKFNDSLMKADVNGDYHLDILEFFRALFEAKIDLSVFNKYVKD